MFSGGCSSGLGLVCRLASSADKRLPEKGEGAQAQQAPRSARVDPVTEIACDSAFFLCLTEP